MRRLLAVCVAVFGFSALSLPAAAEDAATQQTASAGTELVRLEAVYVPGGQPLENAAFEIYPLDPGSGRSFLADTHGNYAEAALVPGRYRITVRYHEAMRSHELNINKGGRHVLDLQAGKVRLSAIPKPGAKAMKRDLRWEIHTYGRDSKGKRWLMGTSDQAQPSFVLPAGYYVATVYTKSGEVKHAVKVSSGNAVDYTVVLQ